MCMVLALYGSVIQGLNHDANLINHKSIRNLHSTFKKSVSQIHQWVIDDMSCTT